MARCVGDGLQVLSELDAAKKYKATMVSEYANFSMQKTYGAFIAAAMRGFGILAGGIVTLIISAAFRAGYPAPAYRDDHVNSTVPLVDFVWRIILMLGLGAAPALLTYYWRMKTPETALVAKNAKQAAADMSKVLKQEIVDEQDKLDEMVTAESNAFAT